MKKRRGKVLKLPLGSLHEMTTAVVRAVVDLCEGNKHEAARLLEVSPRTVYNRIGGYVYRRNRVEAA